MIVWQLQVFDHDTSAYKVHAMSEDKETLRAEAHESGATSWRIINTDRKKALPLKVPRKGNSRRLRPRWRWNARPVVADET